MLKKTSDEVRGSKLKQERGFHHGEITALFFAEIY